MSLYPDSEHDSQHAAESDTLDGRVEALAAWINELDSRVRATEVATGDEKTAKELRRAIEALAKHDPKLEDRLGHRVDVLADRLATLAATVSTTAASLAGKDGEIAALRRELDDGTKRIEYLVTELRASTHSSPDVEELRKAIDAISEQKLPKKLDSRVEDLKTTVEVLSQRLATLSGTVSTTAAGLAGREGEVAGLRKKLEEERAQMDLAIGEVRRAVDPAPVAELRGAVKSLSDATFALKRDNQRGLDFVKAGLETLVKRVDAAATSASATARGLAGNEEQITSLQTAFDEESGRVDSLLVKLHQAMGELAARVPELDGLATRHTVEELGSKVSDLVSRVEVLGASVKETATGYADKEFEIAALGRRFEEISAQVDARVRELHATVEQIAETGSDPELETRFEDLGREIEALTRRLSEVDSATSTGWGHASEALASLERRLSEAVQRVDAAATSASATARGLAGNEEQITSLQTAFDEESGRVDSLLVKLHQAMGELAARVPELDGLATRHTVEELGSKVSDLVSQVEVLGASGGDPELETRFEDLAREIAALTRRLSEVDSATSTGWGHASEAVASLERRLSEVAQRVDVAEHDRAGAAADVARTEEAWGEQHASILEASRALEERVTRLSAAADESAAALVSLENKVDVTGAGVVERDLALRAVSERFETASARVDGLVRELQTALGAMPSGGSDPELDVRLDELTAEIHSLADRFGEVESAAATQAEAAATRADAASADAGAAAALVERRLAELAGRLETVERGSAAAALEIARASATWTDERTSIRDQLEALAGDEPALADLGSRLDAMERSVGTSAADVERASEAWAAGRSSLEAKLDALAAAVSEIGSSSASEMPEHDLAELEERLDGIERDRSKLAGEIAGATAFWSSGLGAIEARLEEVAAVGKEAPPTHDPAVEHALADLARRLDAVEESRGAGAEEVARASEDSAADGKSLAASLDELSRRIDMVDTGRIEVVHAPSSNEPAGGDGRFRLELRALELRMEHAEAAARENREAVLVQLERLASRIEWRLQRLETDPNADEGSSLPQAATAGGPMGEVVPIRGGDA